MSEAAGSAAAMRPGARWLPWALLGLVVLPFHPLWTDFEQVRRGLLLVAAGACLILLPRLPRVRGEAVLLAFVAILALCGGVQWLAQLTRADSERPASFQPWDAGYRLLHFMALLVVLRVGAAVRERAVLPFAVLLAATAAFGLLQRTGFGAIEGFGEAREPVSVFGNLNVAAEWTAVAAMLVAGTLAQMATPRRRALACAALVLVGAYLLVNQSRSALVALPAGLLLLAWIGRRERGWLAFALVVAGGAAGLALDLALPKPAANDHAAMQAEQKRATATLQVRWEIAKSASRLFGESPVLGHGPGQFAVLYPQVRSQLEIEASSQGRQFASEVRTAHDDWLELLVEGGVPGFVAFAVLLIVLQRGQRDRRLLLPMFVLLLMMFVRSPLANAPAVMAAFWFVGVVDGRERAAARWRRPAAVLLGLAMVAAGVLPIAGNQAFVPYLRARAAGEQPPLDAVHKAAACMPFEPRWLQVLAQEQLLAGDLAGARVTAASWVRMRPFDPQAYELLIEVLVTGKALPEAEQLVQHALRFDQAHPELRMWRSWLAMQRGAADEAVLAVVQDPHATLRARLATHFAAMAKVCPDARTAARLRAEHHFVAAVDHLGHQDAESLATAGEHVRALLPAMQEAGLLRSDVRPYVISALHYLDLDQPDRALELGGPAAALGAPFPTWQRELLGEQLERLRTLASWQPLLGAR